ncbi:MAG: T9SS type A sorting domain-containing protein [Saprospiraceae bacterium]
MLRFASILALVAGLSGLAAYRAEQSKFGLPAFAFNSTVTRFFFMERHSVRTSLSDLVALAPETDTTSNMRILMLNVCSYDTAYPGKVHRIIQHYFPACSVAELWEGGASDLSARLADYDAVVVAYPSGGTPSMLKAYGAALIQYAQQGGAVVLTGSHEFSVLQQLGLFDLDFGYFCADPTIHAINPDHPILSGTRSEFTLKNYAYPLDISDPAFVTLADIQGYPVLGYKLIGNGKVVYLGMEYYYEEGEPNLILTNALRWAARVRAPQIGSTVETWLNRRTKRTEEILYAGSGAQKADVFDLKIYPNPYLSKANLDIDLKKPTTVAVDMTDETGRIVSILLPRKNLSAGLFRLELPNVSPGVYFLQCQMGDRTVVKRIVKASAP